MLSPTCTPVDATMRVLILAPLGRNAEVLRGVLLEAGMECAVCEGVGELIAQAKLNLGVVLVTTEALIPRALLPLTELIAAQPSWSDPPLVVLADSGDLDASEANQLSAFRRKANVTLLERPARGFTLVTVLQAALRARSRQYETRDLLLRERAARAEAVRANQIKDDFLATVSHELGTPLSAILLWSRLAMSGQVPAEELPKTMELIHRSADAQAALIEDLLDASRMMSGQLLIVPQDVQLGPAAEAAVEVVRPSAEAKGVHFETSIDLAAGLVRADLSRMRQVIWNILANAVKFTPQSGTVRIVLQRQAAHVRLQISDTGCGITPEFMPHVFERFRQADGRSTRLQGGLGLGLAITKQLVELHGGTISAESAGDQAGATFTVRLPIIRG